MVSVLYVDTVFLKMLLVKIKMTMLQITTQIREFKNIKLFVHIILKKIFHFYCK